MSDAMIVLIVLASGRRLLVREDIGEAHLARLVRILERAC